MNKIYRQAIIFNLSPTILYGNGRGVEVIPTTFTYAKQYSEVNNIAFVTPDINDDLKKSILLSYQKVRAVEEYSFRMDLSDKEEYSELLYIDLLSKRVTHFIIKPL